MSDNELVEVKTVDHSQATTIFVLGLLGVIMCQVLAPVAFFMGNKYKKQCDECGEPMDGMGKAGWILGIVGSVLLLLTLLFLIVYFLFVGAGCVLYIFVVILAVFGAALA